MAAEGAGFLAAAVQIPLPDGTIKAAREQALPVVAQRQGADSKRVPAQGEDFRAIFNIPYLDSAIVTAGVQPLAVQTQRQTEDGTGVHAQGDRFLAVRFLAVL